MTERNNYPKQHILERIKKVINTDTDDFSTLVSIAGLNPELDFRNCDLSNVDFGDADLSNYNINGSDTTGVKGTALNKSKFLAKTKNYPLKHNWEKQKTLKRVINCNGVALHSGKDVAMTIRPADENTGIIFHRTDITGEGAVIPATWDRVVDTRLCTVIGNDEGITVGTIEHLMAALAGCYIDNALVELNASEVPVMDGSAAPFIFLIECAGIVEQEAPRQIVRVLKSVTVQEGESIVTLSPSTHRLFNVDTDFNNSDFVQQSLSVDIGNGVFCKELARARTFQFLHENEMMRTGGPAKGGSLENAVVISNEGVMNEEGLRFDDEFVRHKILVAVGDLYLAGGPILGSFSGTGTSHALNNQLLRKIFSDENAWEWVTQNKNTVSSNEFKETVVNEFNEPVVNELAG